MSASKILVARNPLHVIAAEVRKEFSEGLQGRKLKVDWVGSFFFVRVEDPEGTLPVKVATALVLSVGTKLEARGYVENLHPMSGVNYHKKGVVANWMRL